METETAHVTKRRSRMRRTSTGQRVEIQLRDLEIFALLQRYRYLRSTYIHAFVGGDRTKLIERLGKLYHDGGYLDRPSKQWEQLGARCQPIVYENTSKAIELLNAHMPAALIGSPSPGERGGENPQFVHGLMASDIVASIELGARGISGLRFVPFQEILAKAPDATRNSPAPLRLPVSIVHTFGPTGRTERVDLNLMPDALFGLEYSNTGQKAYRFFALEADRGTMPVARENLRQSSYLRKILGYRQVITRGLHKRVLGVPNLFVLNVMSSEAHMCNVMALLCKKLDDPRNTLFLFKTLPMKCVQPIDNLLENPWNLATGGILSIDGDGQRPAGQLNANNC